MDAYTAERLGASHAHIDAVLRHCTDLRYGSALDVGCGSGFETFELASRFRSVVAIDSRSDFIRRAERIARERGVENIRFLAHDALTPLPSGDRFDLVYCNVMSHHTASRAALVARLAGEVEPGGWLFMAEEAEGCPAMLIDRAIETRDDVMLRDRCRQLVNGLRLRPGFRFFLQGTLEPLLEESGFDVTRVEYVYWRSIPHLQRTWARAIDPKAIETQHPDYLTTEDLAWTVRPLLAVADETYPNLAPEPSLLEKIRRRGPRWARPRQPDWARAERLFRQFAQQLPDELHAASGEQRD